MKTLSALCEPIVSSMKNKEEKAVLCDYVMTPQGCTPLTQPILSTDYECLFCNGKENYCPYVDVTQSAKRVWLCANVDCDVYTKKSHTKATQVPPIPKRALEWALFCEKNGIGDLHHGIKFEDIDQSSAKIDYLFKFASKPFGIIFMQGGAGSGKTFASMAVCELFTRRCTSARFTTQKQMLNDWLDTFKADRFSNYIQSVAECNLLVIDDFGTGEVSPGFMSFFMDIINTRMQWSDRGTIITTNLDDKKFSEFCGEALNDRIKTGQKFLFNNKTRRKQLVL